MTNNVTVVHDFNQLAIGDKIVVVAPDWNYRIVDVYDISERGSVRVATLLNGRRGDTQYTWISEKTVEACFNNAIAHNCLHAILRIESDEEENPE